MMPADSFTRSLIWFITMIVSCTIPAPLIAEELAFSDPLATITQFWAISDEVVDISSLAVATEFT